MKAIINARILTMAGPEIENGYILWEKDKIVKVGHGKLDDTSNLEEITDAKGNYVLPGFIDAHCHIGMWEDGVGFEGDDGNESVDPITPHLRAIDAIFHADGCFSEAVEAGVTTACTGPGSANIFGGQFVAIKTYGRYVDEMVFKAPLAMKAAFGENPKTVYNDKKQSPVTRMASAALMRETLMRAREYDLAIKRYEENPDEHDMPDYDIKLDSLRPVLSGDLILKIHAHRADDILTGIRIANEFNLNYTIEHCTEGYLISDILEEKKVKAIIGPIICDRSKIELRNLNSKAAGILANKGLKIAIMTDHPVTPIQYLPVCAAIAAREGLGDEEALKAITINAAEITGIADRVGSLEPNKDADIVVFDGHPLEFRTKVLRTIINGEMVYEKGL